MKVILFDGSAGVSGDMFAGALLDLGADFSFARDSVLSLGIAGLDIEAGKILKGGISATSFRVIDRVTGLDADAAPSHGGKHSHRSLSAILGLLENSSIDGEVKKHSSAVFRRLGEVEAKIHGVPVEEVHFHELGALDTIADIVAGVAAFVSLDIEKGFVAPLALGTGSVRTAHGILPVPAPATLALLAGYGVKAGFPGGEGQGELTTPTGAALVTAFAAPLRGILEMTVESTGYGAGRKDFSFPNVFRAVTGNI